MRKTTESKIVWCEPTNNRRKPYGTMSADGMLCFGRDMQGKLPRKIRVGFLSDECSLCVEANEEKGFTLAADGKVRMLGVATQLQRLGIDLPVHFLFIEERENSLWKGYIVPPPRRPRPRMAKKAVALTEYPHLLSAYKWLIDRAVYTYAKTTPMEERRATAQAALWEAFCIYTPIHGELKNFLYDEIKKQLIEKNKQYTRFSPYNTFSLDAPVSKNGESTATGYDLFLPRYTNEITSVENKIDMEIFRETHLSPRERKAFKMLMEGYAVDEIQHELDISGQVLNELCQNIGDRWESFNQADGVA